MDWWRIIPSVSVSLFIVVLFVRRDRRQKKRIAAEAKALKENGPAKRAGNDMSAGKATFDVSVIAPDGERVSLGTSTEKPSELSGEPELTTTAFRVMTDERELAINAGMPLKINGIAGAHRKLVDSVTTRDGGIEQRFSFELTSGTRFLLECTVPELGASGPFREGPVTVNGPLVTNPKAVLKEADGFGCLLYPIAIAAAVLPACAHAMGETIWDVLGWIGWGFLVLLGFATVAITD